MQTRLFPLLALLTSLGAQAALPVEVTIHGMTCAFCVAGLERKLQRLPDVATVEVSLAQKTVRLTPKGGTLDLERVRQTIVDAGFTPVEIRSVDHAQP